MSKEETLRYVMSAARVEGDLSQTTGWPRLSRKPCAVRLGMWKRAVVMAV